MVAAPWFLALATLLASVSVTCFILVSTVRGLPRAPLAVARGEAKSVSALAGMWNFRTDAIQELVAELKEGKDGLIAEQKDLASLQAQISAERQEVEKVKQEIVRLRSELDSRVVEVREGEAKNLKTLAQTYSSMGPGAAVPILRELDEDTVVKIFSLMKPDRVGVLLGEMAKISSSDRGGDDSPARRVARISEKIRLMKLLKKDVSQ